MTQFKNIPLPGDQRNQSQIDILANYQYLIDLSSPPAVGGTLPVDHQITGNNTLSPVDGFHNQVSYLNQTGVLSSLTNAVNGQNSNGISYTVNDTWAPFSPQLHFYNGVRDFQITPSIPVRAAFTFVANAGHALSAGAFNVTNSASITRNGVGDYTIAFTNALLNTNCQCCVTTTVGLGGVPSFGGVYELTNAHIRVYSAFGASINTDVAFITVVVWGG